MFKSNKTIVRGWRVWAVIVLACALASCGDDGDEGSGPVIYDIAPAAAAPGALVEILGKRFCGDGPDAAADDGTCAAPPAGVISFGAGDEAVRALGIQSWRHERIEVTVPGTAQPGATIVVVTVNGVASNEHPFEVE
jgi:hypothetical protein